METSDINSRLEFLRTAERLKDTLRNAYTVSGRTESVAEHTWRLALLAITFADELADVDMLKLLKICILHDLGEAIDGDIPAPLQRADSGKAAKERNDFLSLLGPLPDQLSAEFLALWDEYEAGESPEARAAKALDKLETILQHNQGRNPAGFNYEFNLNYGKGYTDRVPIAAKIRAVLDVETEGHVRKSTERQ